MNIGILGFGFMGRTHFSRYQKIDKANVVAIADRALENKKGDSPIEGNLDLGLGELDISDVTLYFELEKLIQDPQIDVVDVCLPTFLHKQYVDMAFEHGKDVICEKPLALKSDDAFAMVEKAKEKNCNFFVAQVLRFWPEFNYLADLVKQQEYGPLKYLSLFRRTASPGWALDDWYLDLHRSGGALDIRIHELDFLQNLFGLPSSVVAQGLEDLNIVKGMFTYEAGHRVFLESNRKLPGLLVFEDGFEALFEDALVRYCGQNIPTVKLFLRSSDEVIEPEFSGDPYLEELRHFVNWIDESDQLSWSSAEDAAQAIWLWEKEVESIKKGGVITLK